MIPEDELTDSELLGLPREIVESSGSFTRASLAAAAEHLACHLWGPRPWDVPALQTKRRRRKDPA